MTVRRVCERVTIEVRRHDNDGPGTGLSAGEAHIIARTILRLVDEADQFEQQDRRRREELEREVHALKARLAAEQAPDFGDSTPTNYFTGRKELRA